MFIYTPPKLTYEERGVLASVFGTSNQDQPYKLNPNKNSVSYFK